MYYNNIKIFYPVIIFMFLFYTNGLKSQITKTENIKTPRNSIVPNTYYVDEFIRSEEILYQDSIQTLGYSNIEILEHSSRTYNCHGYAWSVVDGGNRAWIGWDQAAPSKEMYWEDGSYNSVSINYATKITYSVDHSAVRTETADYYISKWGDGPLVKHHKDHCPFSSPDAGTWRRACDVPQEYTSINSALSNAVPGQTVKVGSGSFSSSENISVPSDKMLQLLSGANLSITGGSLTINGMMSMAGSGTLSFSGSSFNIYGSLSGNNATIYLDRYSTYE